MGNGQGGMADDGCRMADDACELRSGGCGGGQDGETMPEVSQGRIVGHDSQRVTEDVTDDKIGTLSHEGAHVAGQPEQGDGVGQCPPDDVTTPQKAPNKANLEAKQGLESQELKSEIAGAEGRKRSQKLPGRRGGNKAKVPRGRRGQSRARAMADRLGSAAGGRWTGKPKAANCFVWRVFPHSVVRAILSLRVTGR